MSCDHVMRPCHGPFCHGHPWPVLSLQVHSSLKTQDSRLCKSLQPTFQHLPTSQTQFPTTNLPGELWTHEDNVQQPRQAIFTWATVRREIDFGIETQKKYIYLVLSDARCLTKDVRRQLSPKVLEQGVWNSMGHVSHRGPIKSQVFRVKKIQSHFW